MYSTSTQKKNWTFTREELAEMREKTNQSFRERYNGLLQDGESSIFLSTEEELLMARIVESVAVTFSDAFQPPMWDTVKWTAYAYFKRLFLKWSVMDSSPKIVMMACFYLAMKTDEFYVSIEDFVKNLRSATPEQNTARILGLEPEIIRALAYQLAIHCPFKAFDGHILEMKTKLLLNFDLENLREPADRFFKRCYTCDVMLMYPPSQIALAAIKFGLDELGEEKTCVSADVLRDFLLRFMGVEDVYHQNPNEVNTAVEKLIIRVGEIVDCVQNQVGYSGEEHGACMERTEKWTVFQRILEERRRERPGAVPVREEPVDSDDEM